LVSGLTASTTYYYRLRAATGVDADAAAFFGRVYTAGGTLTNTEATAVNQLTIDMKAAGIWTAMKAVYPMVGASAAACAQNLKSSSFTGTFSSGWSFDPAGVIPNGTSAYFNTTLAPSGNLTNNSTHISYYSRTDNNAAAVDGVDIGVTGLLANAYLPVEFFRSRTTDQMQTALYNYGSPTFLTPSNTNSLGFFVGNRTSNVVVNSWKNGTKLGTNTNTETQNITTVAQNFYLSALNLDGAAVQFSVRQCAFSSIGDGLTDTQASDFYTAVQTFNTTLSRAIAP
jgi:hypothetical protein